MTQQEIRNAFDAKVRRGMFNPVLRHLSGSDAEDRLQEAVCMTYEMTARYAERGQVLNDAILVHSCRQRATDLRRRFCSGDGTQPARDVLHPLNYAQGKVEVYRLDGLLDDDGDYLPEEDGERCLPGLATSLQANPVRDIISAVDLEAWVASLPERDQELLAMRQSGATLTEVAANVGVSVSTAWGRLKALGLQLADRAGLPVPGTTPMFA
jgi:DNA-directed RNA polymerase specialized sigma24 family protein